MNKQDIKKALAIVIVRAVANILEDLDEGDIQRIEEIFDKKEEQKESEYTNTVEFSDVKKQKSRIKASQPEVRQPEIQQPEVQQPEVQQPEVPQKETERGQTGSLAELSIKEMRDKNVEMATSIKSNADKRGKIIDILKTIGVSRISEAPDNLVAVIYANLCEIVNDPQKAEVLI